MEEIIKLGSGVEDDFIVKNDKTYDNYLYKDKKSKYLTKDNDTIIIGSSTLSQIYRQLHDKISKLKLDVLTIDDGTITELTEFVRKEINRKYEKMLIWIGIEDIKSSNISVDGLYSWYMLSIFEVIKNIAKDIYVVVERKRENLSDVDLLNIKLETTNELLNGYIKMFKYNRIVLPIGFDMDTATDKQYYKNKEICYKSLITVLEPLCIPELQNVTI